MKSVASKTNLNNLTKKKLMKQTNTEHPILEVISKRWSPRAYDKRMIEKEKLLSIFEAARWAASAFNEQPWSFLVATKENEKMYEKLYSCISEFNKPWSHSAPVLILTLAKKAFNHNRKENSYAYYDLGQAVANLLTQASSYDIYMHQLAGFSKEKTIEEFDIPDGYEPATVIVMGYLGDGNSLSEDLLVKEQAQRVRKKVTEFVKFLDD